MVKVFLFVVLLLEVLLLEIFIRETCVLGGPFRNNWVFKTKELEISDSSINVENNMVFVHSMLSGLFIPTLPSPSLHVSIHIAGKVLKKKKYEILGTFFSLSRLPHHPNLRPIWNFPILQSVFLLFCPNPKFEISYFPLFEIRNLHFLKKISLLPLIVSHFRLTRSRDYWFN